MKSDVMKITSNSSVHLPLSRYSIYSLCYAGLIIFPLCCNLAVERLACFKDPKNYGSQPLAPSRSNLTRLVLGEQRDERQHTGPPDWGLGVALMMPPCRKATVTETTMSKSISIRPVLHHSLSGSMPTPVDSRKEVRGVMGGLLEPKIKIRLGEWNV